MRKIWIIAAGVAAAVAISLIPGVSVASASARCPSGHVCVWVEPVYSGAEGDSLCTGGLHTFAGNKDSGENECANKAVWFRHNGVTTQCLNPGHSSPLFPGQVNEIWVGAEGSRC